MAGLKVLVVINKPLRANTTYMRRESELRRDDDPNVVWCLVDSWLTCMYVLAKQLQAAAAVTKKQFLRKMLPADTHCYKL